MLVVALWLRVFTGLVLAPFPRTPFLLWGAPAAMVASIVYAAAADPTPWGMAPAAVMLRGLFGVPLAGRLAGALPHRALTDEHYDAMTRP